MRRLTRQQVELLRNVAIRGTVTFYRLGLPGPRRLRHLEGLGLLRGNLASEHWQITKAGVAAIKAAEEVDNAD